MINLERTVSMDSLYRSCQRISQNKACPGFDGIDLSYYRSDLQKNLRSLQTSIITGNYRPFREKTFNHKDREICISSIDDKIVQTSLAKAISTLYTPAKSVHGFIGKRSVFTAKKTLDDALRNGVYEYLKVDIKRFYDSINVNILFSKIENHVADTRLLELFKLLLDAHKSGLSTGSCLSPALSNLYLDEFDRYMEKNSVFYSRYVDDMLVAPVSNLPLIEGELAEVSLGINREKSKPVNAAEGFRYLGFDIKRDIELAIQNNDFSLAESIYESSECDITAENPVTSEKNVESRKSDYELPSTIKNVVSKCHLVRTIIEKAKTEHYLAFHEKTHLLQLFHCLGEDGAMFIHDVLSNCDDYDFAVTQRRINRYTANNPIGCKKLRERIDAETLCSCNFGNEKIYPTPIIHALRIDRECFKPTSPKENIGHFKAKNPRDKAVDALSAIIELNKKQFEITEQQKILKGQIEDLFERTNSREFHTPQGLIIKSEDGIFLKVG